MTERRPSFLMRCSFRGAPGGSRSHPSRSLCHGERGGGGDRIGFQVKVGVRCDVPSHRGPGYTHRIETFIRREVFLILASPRGRGRGVSSPAGMKVNSRRAACGGVRENTTREGLKLNHIRPRRGRSRGTRRGLTLATHIQSLRDWLQARCLHYKTGWIPAFAGMTESGDFDGLRATR